jgi:hypothetical protein
MMGTLVQIGLQAHCPAWGWHERRGLPEIQEFSVLSDEDPGAASTQRWRQMKWRSKVSNVVGAVARQTITRATNRQKPVHIETLSPCMFYVVFKRQHSLQNKTRPWVKSIPLKPTTGITRRSSMKTSSAGKSWLPSSEMLQEHHL